MKKTLLSLLALFQFLALWPQAPVLVKNINTTQAGSGILNIRAGQSGVVFEANTPEYGREVFFSDGTAPNTEVLADIAPGALPSSIWELSVIEDDVYFFTYDSEVVNLWVINLATREAKNLLTVNTGTGIGGGSNGHFTRIGEETFFLLRNAGYEFQLWKTDNTPDGTVLITGLMNSSLPENFIVFNDKLFFTMNHPAFGHSLWSGDANGASLFFDPNPTNENEFGIFDLTVFDGHLYFVANDNINGYELWKTDGTAGGTFLFKDIFPGAPPGFPRELTLFNDELYFSADDGENGVELWKSDGSPDGTQMLVDIEPGSGHSSPGKFITNGNLLLFAAVTSAYGAEMWVTDGTAGGTALLKDINQGASNAITQNTATGYANGQFFFTANDGANGLELWASDGTLANTRLVKDIFPGADGSKTTQLITHGEKVFFQADNFVNGQELWASDGSEDGTNMIRDLNTTENGSTPRLTAPVLDGRLIFQAFDIATGVEPYISDGTEEGTFMLMDINPGSGSSDPRFFLELNGKVYFQALTEENTYYRLFETDGTPEGTRLAVDMHFFNRMVKFNGYLYFDALDEETGEELWRSDGTPTGTQIVKDINPLPGVGSGPRPSEVSLDGYLYFTAHDGIHGVELWRTDGTEEGTSMIMDIFSGNNIPNTYIHHIVSPVAFNGAVYFRARHHLFGDEIWKTDGTEAGTMLLKDIIPGTTSSSPVGLTVAGDLLYFTASDSRGAELWKSDGTEEGTQIVKDINPDGGSFPYNHTGLDGKLVFVASTGQHGGEPWVSDGTPEGTFLLKDIKEGPGESYPRYLFPYNDILLFNSEDTIHGRELWVTDGTVEGTSLLLDMIPGPGASDPSDFALIDSSVYFIGTGAEVGRELWWLCMEEPCDEIINNARDWPAAEDEIVVFPNPASTYLNLRSPGNLPLSFELFSSTGRRMASGNGEKADISHLPAGIYFLRIFRSDGKNFMQKVLKK